MKDRYRYVFVVLVYKNIEVLRDFFQSLQVSDSHVIVVNSYYDEKSLKNCREVAISYSADFIPIENKGFGYGNNIGTKYAMEHYKYDYLILSNSDIYVKSLAGLDKIDENQALVLAPYTHLLKGKIQNPNIPWRFRALFFLLKSSYSNKSRVLLSFTHIITRLSRDLFRIYQLLSKKSLFKIYSCHGSFIILTKLAVEKLYPLFDDRMFLYNEELYLAENCRLKGVSILFCPSIDVLHLEGASSGGLYGFEHNKESFAILYEWMKQKELL